jgi:S1-C subfamily serine protease
VLTVGTRFAGNRVPFVVHRAGKQINLRILLGKYPVEGQTYAAVRPPAWRGLRVDYTTILMRPKRAFLGTDRLKDVADGGVLVTEVESGSPAADAGIEADPELARNPIITHVGGTRVRNPGEFYEAVKNLKGTVDVKTDQDKHAVPE